MATVHLLGPDRVQAAASDENLVDEVLAGHKAAFAELASRYHRQAERLCRRFFRDAEIVRDLVQESLSRAFIGLASYRAEMPVARWLRTIVINVCYDELRRQRRRPELLVADFSGAESGWLELVSYATPERIVEAAEQRREATDLAHRLLETLRPEDRLVLVLKESQELSVAEIATQIGWSEAKVKIRAFRARRALRKQAEVLLKEALRR